MPKRIRDVLNANIDDGGASTRDAVSLIPLGCPAHSASPVPRAGAEHRRPGAAGADDVGARAEALVHRQRVGEMALGVLPATEAGGRACRRNGRLTRRMRPTSRRRPPAATGRSSAFRTAAADAQDCGSGRVAHVANRGAQAHHVADPCPVQRGAEAVVPEEVDQFSRLGCSIEIEVDACEHGARRGTRVRQGKR